MTKKKVKEFLNSIKRITGEIPYISSATEAKRVVAVAIRESRCTSKDVLSFIKDQDFFNSLGMNEKAWASTINYHIKWGGKFGEMLAGLKKATKSHITQEQFMTLASSCGACADSLLTESVIDNVMGWDNLLHKLVAMADSQPAASATKTIVDEQAEVSGIVPNFWEAPCKEATKEGMGKNSKRRYSTPIVQLTLEGEWVCEYPNAKRAEDLTKIDHKSIAKCCKGEAKTAGKHKWMFKADYEKRLQEQKLVA